MADLSFLSQLPRVLKDWLPKAASIAVADEDRYLVYRPGAYDLRITPGEAVRPGSIAERVLSLHDRVESDVDSSVFGIPYYGLGYPIRTESGSESALTVILPPKRSAPAPTLSFLIGQADGVWRPLAVEDVAYLESYQKKTWVHTADGTFTTNHTLQSLEQRLPKNRFLRIHRSYIVDIAFIESISRDEDSNLTITLTAPARTRLPVAHSYVQHVRGTLGF